jgi:hypothetical protein
MKQELINYSPMIAERRLPTKQHTGDHLLEKQSGDCSEKYKHAETLAMEIVQSSRNSQQNNSALHWDSRLFRKVDPPNSDTWEDCTERRHQ